MTKYRIIVDMYENKSESRMEWEFESPVLCSLENISDELVIKQGKLRIIKKIGITEYNKYFVKAIPEEFDVELTATKNIVFGFEDTILLFQGVNYISIENLKSDIFIQYIINSPFTDGLAMQSDLKAELAIKNAEISAKVSKNEIISEINLSPEVAKIQAEKIKLEGYTTINGGFSVDLQGNMSCQDATINGGLVVRDGLYACLVFKNISDFDVFSNNYTSIGGLVKAGYNRLGWATPTSPFGYHRLPIMIPFSLPTGFDVEYAEVSIEHQSVNWLNVLFGSGIGGNNDYRNFNNSKVKDIELYVNAMPPDTTTSLNFKETTGSPSEDVETFMITKVTNAWGIGLSEINFTNGLKRATSINIKNYVQGIEDGIVAIAPKIKVIPPGTGDGASDWPESKVGRESTALMSGALYIYGYLKMVNND